MLSSLKSPGTMADDASTGSRSWSTPDNAKVSDNTYTIATIDDPGCFLAGTEITTPNGIEKIERIIKGDVITSYDKNTKKFVSSKVRTIFSLSREGYFLLKTNSQKIFVTAEHPFLTIKGWKMVKELRVGNKLLTEKGYVKLLQKDFIKKQITVFNLKVE